MFCAHKGRLGPALKKKFKRAHPGLYKSALATRAPTNMPRKPKEPEEPPVGVIACDEPDAFEIGLQRRERLAKVEHLEATTLALQLQNHRTYIGLLSHLGIDDATRGMLRENLLALMGQTSNDTAR